METVHVSERIPIVLSVEANTYVGGCGKLVTVITLLLACLNVNYRTV